MHFFHSDAVPRRIRAVYTPGINEYNGRTSVQFNIEQWEAV
jgi:hypothetical protein